jgi:uncharacterized secreted protein with C-terminal beta-propeller domain
MATSQTLLRPMVATLQRAVALSVGTSLALVLAGCGGGGSPGGSTGGDPPVVINPLVDNTSPILAASSPGDLLGYVKNKIKTAAVPESLPTTGGTVLYGVPAPAPVAASASTAGAAPAFSGTRLQEQGVDEDDLVKTDGTMLYALVAAQGSYNGNVYTPASARLLAQRRQADGSLQPASSLPLDNTSSMQIQRSGMYLASAAQRIAVLGQSYQVYALAAGTGTAAAPPSISIAPGAPSTSVPYPGYSAPQISLELINLSTTTTLSVASRIKIDGNLVGSRMIGNYLYVVSTWSPNLSSFAGPNNTSANSLTTANILPTVQIDNAAAQPLLPETDCYVQAANKSAVVQITTITAFDMGSANTQRTSRCFVGGSDGLYMSPDSVYLTSSRYYTYATNAAQTQFTSGSKTDIHKFALQGAQINYKGSGEVPGHLGWDTDKIAYRMSEHQGDLRVVSFTGQTGWTFSVNSVGNIAATAPLSTQSASPATLTVLRESAGNVLKVVGSLPNSQRPAALGHAGEQVYAVQFVGPRAYVVTFRRTDPLYVLDLTNPADPYTLGELQMPGFSDYLYPMGDKLLLGVGKDADSTGRLGGVKVALMNVANPAQPSVVNAFVIGKNGSSSGVDYGAHGINIFQQGTVFRIALPVRVNDTPSGSPGFFNTTSQGLQRFEVDTATSTLTSKPVVPSALANPSGVNNNLYTTHALDQERALQIDANVYYFTGGQFLSAAW